MTTTTTPWQILINAMRRTTGPTEPITVLCRPTWIRVITSSLRTYTLTIDDDTGKINATRTTPYATTNHHLTDPAQAVLDLTHFLEGD
ncbi:hypothetical protein [Actinomyces timonensis]|uniref:hypothetical protein n=1 Tax=Actinomyces timonensis TaxID=1288391 RepID=UPI0002D8A3CF|nr:hypothetical protein [Actinomyces timonensis]